MSTLTNQGPILAINRSPSNRSLYSQHSNRSQSPLLVLPPNHQTGPNPPIIVSTHVPSRQKDPLPLTIPSQPASLTPTSFQQNPIRLPDIKQKKVEQLKAASRSFANDAAQRHALFNQDQSRQSKLNSKQELGPGGVQDGNAGRYEGQEKEARKAMGTSQGSRWMRSQSLNASREQKSFKQMIRHFHRHNSIMVEALNRFWQIFEQAEAYLRQSSYQISLYDPLEATKMKMESFLERRINLQNLPGEKPGSEWTQEMFIGYYGKYRKILMADYQEESLHRPYVLKKYKNCVFFGHMTDGKKEHGILHYFNGKCFEGRFRDDQKQYGLEIDDNQLYLGHFNKGLRHGDGILKTPQALAAGTFTDGQFSTEKAFKEASGTATVFDHPPKTHKQLPSCKRGFEITHAALTVYDRGNVIIKNNAGDLFIGNMNQEGQKEGEGVELFANGDIYIGKYEAGSPEGYGEYYWENGSHYRGQFLSGMRHGRGIWQMVNGDCYEGQYMNDKKNGQGVYLWKNGSRYEGNFENDYRHGYGEMKWQDGRVYKGKWLNGIEKNLLITLEKPGAKNQKRASSNNRGGFRTLEQGNNRKIPLDKLKSLYNPSYQ